MMWRHRIARDRFSGRAGSCVRGLYCTLREQLYSTCLLVTIIFVASR